MIIFTLICFFFFVLFFFVGYIVIRQNTPLHNKYFIGNAKNVTHSRFVIYIQDKKRGNAIGTIIRNAENNRLLFIIIIFRFVVSLTYYGVILNVGNVGGDFYLNLFLLTIIDYPVKFLTLLLLNRIGRKKVYVAYMLLGGIMCMGTIYPVVQKHECKFL